VQPRQLFERHRARLVQPAQVGGQIGERRFDEHPAAGFVHLAQSFQDVRFDLGRGRVEEWTEIAVGFDLAGANDLGRSGVQRLVGLVAADRRQQRELLERPLE
jgi:hypothetical protein